eukprot:1534378-Amphidinium_carterae.1
MENCWSSVGCMGDVAPCADGKEAAQAGQSHRQIRPFVGGPGSGLLLTLPREFLAPARVAVDPKGCFGLADCALSLLPPTC